MMTAYEVGVSKYLEDVLFLKIFFHPPLLRRSARNAQRQCKTIWNLHKFFLYMDIYVFFSFTEINFQLMMILYLVIRTVS